MRNLSSKTVKIAGLLSLAFLFVNSLYANSSICVSVFNQQQHFAYVDSYGTIWDAWYNGPHNDWNLERINNGGDTSGPAAGAGPGLFVSVFNQQHHFAYLDIYGNVWDAWYNGPANSWNLQEITQGGRTPGPPAASAVFVSVFNQQQHFVYGDSGGTIWDAWYNGPQNSWNLQQINNGGKTSGPSAAFEGAAAYVSVFNQQQHFAYSDFYGTIWDAWYDGLHNSWNLQKINRGGNTIGPAAQTPPFVSVFNQQQHFVYRDSTGLIWDAWYNGPANSWNLQVINYFNGAGKTSGPPTSSCCDLESSYFPTVSVFNQQQHFAYPDQFGAIWDAWYNGPANSWNLQKINLGGNTKAPATTNGPAISVFNQQQHFTFQDLSGVIWDAWYDGVTNSWKLQQINLGGLTKGPAAGPDGSAL